MEDFFRIGVITKPHGLKGEVKVFPTTSPDAHRRGRKTALLIPPRRIIINF